MINKDSDALECDLAQTYQIYEMKSLPMRKIAVFASGLGRDSRIIRKLSGTEYALETILLASISDGIQMMLWTRSKEGTPKPEQLLPKLLGGSVDGNDNTESMTIEEFEAIRARLAVREEGGVDDG